MQKLLQRKVKVIPKGTLTYKLQQPIEDANLHSIKTDYVIRKQDLLKVKRFNLDSESETKFKWKTIARLLENR